MPQQEDRCCRNAALKSMLSHAINVIVYVSCYILATMVNVGVFGQYVTATVIIVVSRKNCEGLWPMRDCTVISLVSR